MVQFHLKAMERAMTAQAVAYAGLALVITAIASGFVIFIGKLAGLW